MTAEGNAAGEYILYVPPVVVEAAASQPFAIATALNEPSGSTDAEPERSSRRGVRDELFSRLARTERRRGGFQAVAVARRIRQTASLSTTDAPLRRLQAAATDRP